MSPKGSRFSYRRRDQVRRKLCYFLWLILRSYITSLLLFLYQKGIPKKISALPFEENVKDCEHILSHYFSGKGVRTLDICKYLENFLLKRVEEWCNINWNEMWNERGVCLCVCVRMLICVCLFLIAWTVAHRAPPGMEFSRQEYWGRLISPTAGNLPNSGIKLTSLASPALAGEFFTTAPSAKPKEGEY